MVVNTCGFIDSAVEESLDAIGEALAENGKVIVTGCLGAKGDMVKQAHPKVLAVTGPHATAEVMDAVHAHCPKPHDPYIELVPPQGVRLTPGHYAYLKISEGCNHRCTFCIIPSLRGDLVSRPVGEVMQEAENLVNAGVKELLVISQDTSAYGLDVKYRTGFWGGKPLKTRMTELAGALGSLRTPGGEAPWVRLHYVYPYPHVDEVIPLMAEGKILPYLDIPFQHANERILKLMKRPASSENVLARIKRWREVCPDITLRSTFIVGFPGETEEEFEELLDFLERGATRPRRRIRLFSGGRGGGQRSAGPHSAGRAERAPGAADAAAGRNQHRKAYPQDRARDHGAGRGSGRGGRHRAQRGGRAGDRRYGVHRQRAGAGSRRVRYGARDRFRRARSVG